MPPDPAATGPHLRAHAALLRDLRDKNLGVLRADAAESLTLVALSLDQLADVHDAGCGAAVEGRQAEAVRLALLRRQDAAHGVLRLMARPAPVPVVPRPAAEVIQFPRGVA